LFAAAPETPSRRALRRLAVGLVRRLADDLDRAGRLEALGVGDGRERKSPGSNALLPPLPSSPRCAAAPSP
jgi:hypothetical protein